jgi:hypothetical protein
MDQEARPPGAVPHASLGQRFFRAFTNQGFSTTPPFVPDRGLVTRWSLDGGNWSERIPVEGQSSKFAPALVDGSETDRPVMAYVANNDTNDILITRYDFNADRWTDSETAGGQRSKTTPAMAVFRNKLFMVYVSNDDRNLLVVHSASLPLPLLGATHPVDVQWSQPVHMGPATKFAPALHQWGAELVVAYVDNSDTFELRTISSTDGEHWTDPRPVHGQASFAGPTLAAFEGQLFLVYVAANERRELLTATSHDGITWSDSQLVEAGFGAQQSNNAPAVLSGSSFWGQPLRMVYTDFDGALRPTISGDGVNWTNPGIIGAIFGRAGVEGSDSSDLGVALSTHSWFSWWDAPFTRAFPRDSQ